MNEYLINGLIALCQRYELLPTDTNELIDTLSDLLRGEGIEPDENEILYTIL